MTLKLPRVGEILAAAFGALLALSLFLPWYRTAEASPACPAGEAGCPRETVTGFEAFGAIDILLLLVAIGGVALLVLEMTQRTHAVPVAWSVLLMLLALLALAVVAWRTLSPPGEGYEPLFALLGLVACGGVAAGCFLSMRNASPATRAVRGAGGSEPPEPLPVPTVGEGAER